MVGSAAGGIGKGGVNMAYIRKTVDRWDIETNWGGTAGRQSAASTPERRLGNV